MKQNKIQYMVQAAMIAALYTVLTYIAGLLNLAYGPIQFRFSEALTILPIFTPAAIPGLTIGCFLSNLMSGYGPVDWIFGSLASLIAALLTRAVRNIRFKNIPFLAPLPPVLINAFIIGLQITLMGTTNILSFSNFNITVFLTNFITVGFGQLIICYVLGIPLIILMEKTSVGNLFQSQNRN